MQVRMKGTRQSSVQRIQLRIGMYQTDLHPSRHARNCLNEHMSRENPHDKACISFTSPGLGE